MPFALADESFTVALLCGVWLTEKLFERRLGMSPILGQLCAGVLLGPPLANAVPFVPALRLIGKLGVLMFVIDSGLATDLELVRKQGGRALTAAAAGVLVPALLAFAVFTGVLGTDYKTALAAGAAIAPTSLGFAAQLLAEVGLLGSAAGQFVCTAAVADDVISLLLLAEVQALQGSTLTAWSLLRPLAASVGSIGLGAVLALAAPARASAALRRVPPAAREAASLLALLLLGGGFAVASATVGSSDLLGCFVAGVAASQLPEVQHAWTKHMKPFTPWGLRLFFACTIAFGVPSLTGGEDSLFAPRALWAGALLGVCATAGKFVVGLFLRPVSKASVNLIGWSMNGRGEFSFLLTDQARADGLLTGQQASAVIWALLIASVASPIGFRCAVKQRPAPAAGSKDSPEAKVPAQVVAGVLTPTTPSDDGPSDSVRPAVELA